MESIPVNEPLLNGNEQKYLSQCIDTGWISSEGPFVQQFEAQFTKRVSRQHGIAVANGSAALDCAISALQIGPGDEVILPTFTIISCAGAIVRSGARPVLVDCDPNTWNMDVNQIEKKITSKTKAIMAVHIYGMPVDMAPVMDLAANYHLHLMEDAAEAHGLTYNNRPCGSFGDLSTFSFYPNKLITTGEGGMIVTDDEKLAERCRSLRNLCFQTGQRFVHEELGWNLRMSNIQAALGVAQMERFDEFLAKKRHIGQQYTQLLKDIDGIELPVSQTPFAHNAYWVFGVVLNDELPFDASEVIARLNSQGVGCRPFFWPMHEQPVFLKMGLFENERYPIAERISRRGFYIPGGLAITDKQIKQVSDILHRVIK